MFIDDLKRSILQKAIQGKLVKQNQNDKSAKEVLKRIIEEKEKLIKDGKIKKEKKLSPIKEEDKLYDIPSTWEWVKLGDICTINIGNTPDRENIGYWMREDVNRFSISDLKDGQIVSETREKISNDAVVECFKSGIARAGTLLMSFKLTIGKTSILGCDAAFNEAIAAISPIINEGFFIRNFLLKVLPLLAKEGNTKNAMKGATLNKDSLNNLIIPFPPLEEQNRIVEKLDILIPLLDEAKPIEEELINMEKEFPNKFWKSILKRAIKGELVRDENDETPDCLLEKVNKEKERLIKEKKIKKTKNLPPITDKEKFLDLGNDCKWVRLGDIAIVEKGNTGIMKAIPGSFPMYTTAEQPVTHNKYQVDGNAVMIPLVSSTGHGHASIKRLHYGEGKFAVGSILSVVQPYGDIISAKYLYCYLSTFKERLLVNKMKGMANVTLTIDSIKEVVVPIASTKNQKKLEEFVKLCDELEEQIG